jgi:DNA-binding transcriptional regulator YiaG
MIGLLMVGRRMNPSEIRAAREALGLSQSGLARVLRMGPNGATRIREWEEGRREITGPAAVALSLLLEQRTTFATKPTAREERG